MALRKLVRDGISSNAVISLGISLGMGLAAASCSSVPQSFGGVVCKSSSLPHTTDKEDDLARSNTDPGAKQGQTDDKEECTFREEVIGSYEDRIRNFSSSERVFEFFASVTNEKGTFMTPADFTRAITPFQHRRGVKVGSDNFKFNFQAKNNRPTKQQKLLYKALLKNILEDNRVTPAEVKELLAARDRYHITEIAHREVLEELGVTQAQLDDLAEAKGGITKDRFLAMVDIDGDGLISYQEFMLFRTLLAIPPRTLAIAFRMFDRDDSGAVDWFEFESFMNVLKGETNVGKTEIARQHRKDAQVANRLFFAEDSAGDNRLTMKKFSTYVHTLQQEILVMQFHQWDNRGEGMLTATEFAKFLATKITSERKLYKEYLKRAESEELAQLKVDISVEEFLAFHELLQHLPEMEVAMKVSESVEGKGLDRPEFLRAAQAALKGGRLRQQGSATARLGLPKEYGMKAVVGNINSFRMANTPFNHKNTSNNQIKATEAVKDENVLSPGVLDTLFVLLDTNKNGRLEQNEFMKLMKRQAAIPDPPRQLGIVSFLKQVKDCAEEVAF